MGSRIMNGYKQSGYLVTRSCEDAPTDGSLGLLHLLTTGPGPVASFPGVAEIRSLLERSGHQRAVLQNRINEYTA
jgi:hypothetical protein